MKLTLLFLTIPMISVSGLPPASKRMRVAVVRGRIEDVRHCLAKGESPVSTWPKGGMSPLMMALKWDKSEVVQLLVSVQLEDQVKLKNDTDQTPLYFAAEAANVTVIAQLLKAGASIDCKDANGLSALYAAVKGLQIHNKPEHAHAIKLLIDSGAYAYPEQKQLWELVTNTQNQEVIELLAPYFIKRKMR